MEVLRGIWNALTVEEIVVICTAASAVFAVVEKGFDKDFIFRKIFRLLWVPVKFLLRGVFSQEPLKSYLDSCAKMLTLGGTIAEIKSSMDKVVKEVTMNGGASMKDVVVRLARHDEGNWNLFTEIRDAVRIINLRLDILDAHDKRMSYQLSPRLECTKISPEFLRFFGYTEDDILGNDWEFCIAERSRADALVKWTRSAEKHIPYRNEQVMVDHDGGEHLCLVRGYPMNNFEGHFNGFYGTVEVIRQV